MGEVSADLSALRQEAKYDVDVRRFLVFACWLTSMPLLASDSIPFFNYDVAQEHELKPHRRDIPVAGAEPSLDQLHLTLTVSPTGEVTDVAAAGTPHALQFWPRFKDEVLQWKFVPFELKRNAVTAKVDEYIEMVPSERFPKIHVNAPTVQPNSKVTIILSRSGCYGSCPDYEVQLSTDGITFQGGGYVIRRTRHLETIDPETVRGLARKFVTADFYSMQDSYFGGATDMPTYVLSIEIDGRKKEVADYLGLWDGMPGVIRELEDDVDIVARTRRWVEGSDRLWRR